MSWWSTLVKSLTLVLHLGLIVSTAIGVGYLIGSRLDNYLGITGKYSVWGIILGAISGIYLLYKEVTGFTHKSPRR